MRRMLPLLLMLLFVLPIVNAQETDGYRLRVSSAEEYLAALPEILRTDTNPHEVKQLFRGLKASIIDEWQVRYRGANVSPERMIETLYAMLDFPRSVDEASVWGKVVVEALTATGTITLDEQEPTISTFGAITVEAIPRDFNADGQPEWVVRLQQGESRDPFYLQILVVQQTSDGLRFVQTPLRSLFDAYGTQQLGEAFLGDMTGDDVPEWVVASIGTGSGYAYGELIIFQWRDDSLAVISPPSGYENEKTAMVFEGRAAGGLHGFEIEYVDVDESGTTEVLIRHLFNDNWDCDSTETATFKWVESSLTFQFTERERVFRDSAGCAVRFAQDAMWAHDYETAVFHFERALALYDREDVSYWGDNIWAYAAIRLALAYALVGEIHLASNQLDKLRAIDTIDMLWPIPEMFHALKDFDLETEGAVGLCTVLWNEVASVRGAQGYWDDIYDNPPPLIDSGYGVSASRTGCDLPAVAPEQYAMIPTPTAEPYCCPGDYAYEDNPITPTPDPAVLQFQRGEALYADAQAAEAAGDVERALASYVEIVTAAPETPWAKLAALHLEPVE
jgi:hypothetical protein